MYIGWIVAALAALLCGVMTAAWRKSLQQLRVIDEDTREKDGLQRDLARMRSDAARLRRENALLRRDLSDADSAAEELEQERNAMEQRLEQSEGRAYAAEMRRAQAEKDVYAAKMKVNLLEKELADERSSRRDEEEMYQDILRERDAELHRLRDSAPKKRPKKPVALDRQITFGELLGDSRWN